MKWRRLTIAWVCVPVLCGFAATILLLHHNVVVLHDAREGRHHSVAMAPPASASAAETIMAFVHSADAIADRRARQRPHRRLTLSAGPRDPNPAAPLRAQVATCELFTLRDVRRTLSTCFAGPPPQVVSAVDAAGRATATDWDVSVNCRFTCNKWDAKRAGNCLAGRACAPDGMGGTRFDSWPLTAPPGDGRRRATARASSWNSNRALKGAIAAPGVGMGDKNGLCATSNRVRDRYGVALQLPCFRLPEDGERLRRAFGGRAKKRKKIQGHAYWLFKPTKTTSGHGIRFFKAADVAAGLDRLAGPRRKHAILQALLDDPFLFDASREPKNPRNVRVKTDIRVFGVLLARPLRAYVRYPGHRRSMTGLH